VNSNHLVSFNISQRRFRRSQKSKLKRKSKRFRLNYKNEQLRSYLRKDYNYFDVLHAFLPKNLKYLIFESDFSPINIDTLNYNKSTSLLEEVCFVPKEFSLISKPKESYDFVRDVASALILQKAKKISIDYSNCEKISLDAQIFLDVILKDIISFYKRCSEYKKTRPAVKSIGGDNVVVDDVRKMLWSIGSPAIHADSSIRYSDIVSYKLCIHNSLSKSPKSINRKDIDTTNLVDYVKDSLARVNRELSDDKIEDLCIVISEILINAEEHSSNKFRFSIGYFTEKNDNGLHYGVFRLVIMNFGQTIYEKFKDPDCPNPNSVQKMKDLSQVYNNKKFFSPKEFEEETLWTLYSLQEGVTCTDPIEYKKRGNGSIRFIESFFNIKGENELQKDISQMTILSGNTKIVFDGTYKISENVMNGEKFQYMTFNESGNIMNKPDANFVSFVQNYFPGTIISAEIIFNEDDLSYGNEPK